MAAISKSLADALDKSEQVVMVHLNLDTPMYFQATDAVRLLLCLAPYYSFNNLLQYAAPHACRHAP
uniref:Uncharacterized protein n=1 Tax=Hyaloperonospora arabidopsidis (strain Emoy2) TaxID=559515 RepID=M4B680_HYAAE